MARIEGVDLPRQKRIDIALTYIFGLGRTSARKILDEAQVEYGIRVQELSWLASATSSSGSTRSKASAARKSP